MKVNWELHGVIIKAEGKEAVKAACAAIGGILGAMSAATAVDPTPPPALPAPKKKLARKKAERRPSTPKVE